jgi:excisionase family DNA binding protein
MTDQILEAIRALDAKLSILLVARDGAGDYLTIRAAAKLGSVSESAVRRAIWRGDLPAWDISSGRRTTWRIARADFDVWMRRRGRRPIEAPPLYRPGSGKRHFS